MNKALEKIENCREKNLQRDEAKLFCAIAPLF
jgi:hypothetical protein